MGIGMTTDEFIQKLDGLFAKQEYGQAEPFMLSALEEAKEREDWGLYLSVGNEMIGYYRSVSQFQKAYRISEDMLLLMEELQMDQSAEFATVLLNTATAYSFDEKFEMALQFYRRAEQIYHLLVKPDDYLFAGLYNNMSSLMEKMGKNGEALEFLIKALGILQNYPDREMEAATNFTNLGLLYLKTGDYDSGKKCVLQAISMFEALDVPASHYSAALSAMSEIYYHEKDYEKSLVYYDKTLDEIRKHYGLNLSYAIVCENCAVVCREAGLLERAEEYLKIAAEVRKKFEAQNQDQAQSQEHGQSQNQNQGQEQSKDRDQNQSQKQDRDRRETVIQEKAEQAVPDRIQVQQDVEERSADSAQVQQFMTKGLERCRMFYQEYGRPMLEKFPGLKGHFTAGLAGEGSECFGYDDAVSTDHDYFPRFFIWLDDEAYEKYGTALEQAYSRLPNQFEEFPDTILTPEASFRCGVCKTSDFYFRLLGRKKPPQTLEDWILLQETRLATATNGEIFEASGGGFMEQRQIYLSYFPEDVRKKKLAARLRKMAQMGQYQYARCMQRGESVAAQIALSDFIQNTCSCCFLLEKQYMPYFKWMHRRMQELPVFSEAADKLGKLSDLPSQQKKWDLEKRGQYRFHLNKADEKVVLIEEIAQMVAAELRRQGLAESTDTYLEPYAAEVESRIEDAALRTAKLV